MAQSVKYYPGSGESHGEQIRKIARTDGSASDIGVQYYITELSI